MEKKHAVITGAASGLGLGCAQRLASLGYDVTIADVDRDAAIRAAAGLSAAGAATAQAEPVDLADPTSIADFADRMLQQARPIDLLVNNAGIYAPSQRKLSPEGHELTLAIAHFGHFRLTAALWPLLLSAPSARVVSISSLVHRYARLQLDDLRLESGYTPILAYRNAKLACLLFSIELQRRLEHAGSRVRSYAAHPGVCRTAIGRRRPRSDSDSSWQRLSSKAMAWGLSHIGQSPENGAAPVVEAATGDRFPPGSLIGPRWVHETFGAPSISHLGTAARDPALGLALWQRTEAIVGSNWAPT